MHRYLAILWDPLDPESVRTFQSLGVTPQSKPSGWMVAAAGPGTLVIHTGLRQGSAEAYPLQNDSGVVLGRIFDRRQGEHAAPPRITFDAAETRRIVASAGQHLVDRYWGSYFAVVYDEPASKHHVWRDPTGTVPCYQTRLKNVDIFFSHIEDCVGLLPISFSIDRRYLTRWLIYSAFTSADTGLENVKNVLAGERVTLSQGQLTRSVIWDPIAIAGTPRLEAADKVAKVLRATVQNAVDAWACCYGNIAHKLSGGLDSAIVAGCLAQAPAKPRISYLNLSIDIELDRGGLHLPGMDQNVADKIRAIAGHGDERYFARMVAQRWETALLERQRTVSMDLRRLWHVPLQVRPALYYTSMEMDDAELELVECQRVEAFFSGQAGDSVFLATQQPLPAMDYAYMHGLERGLWQQLAATSRLSKESLWAVLGKALRHGILRRHYAAPIAVLGQATLVAKELVQTLASTDFESELAQRISRAALPPGKKNHARGVAASSYYEFAFHGCRHADHVDPLNSQPIWELMLQIPTWTVLDGGISRGLARQAFADLLPAAIRKRQVKGTGGPFYQHLVRRNKDFLQATLLDGLLVRQGYLDRRRVEECLSATEPSRTVSAVSILNYLAAEIWLQKWTESRGHTTVQGSAGRQNATRQPSRHSLAAFK